MRKNPLGLIFVLAAGVTAVWAQVDRATVTGTLHDASGAVVSDARVSVTYPATGLKRSVVSNGSGAYLIAGLPLGQVLIQAEKAGFRGVETETTLGVGETKTLDFALEVSRRGYLNPCGGRSRAGPQHSRLRLDAPEYSDQRAPDKRTELAKPDDGCPGRRRHRSWKRGERSVLCARWRR